MRHIEAIYGKDLDDLLSVIADLHYRRYAQDKVQISGKPMEEGRRSRGFTPGEPRSQTVRVGVGA